MTWGERNTLKDLPSGWDSYKGKPITSASIAGAEKWLSMVRGSDPQITPTNSGGVQFEWHEQGIDFEVEIGHDGIVQSWE